MNTIKKVGTLNRSKSSVNTALTQGSSTDGKKTKKQSDKETFNAKLKRKQSTVELLIAKPYEEMKVPEINKEQRKKVGTSMQRRLSVHLPKDAVNMAPDFSNAPALPGSVLTGDVYGSNQTNISGSNIALPSQQPFKPTYDSDVLRKLLSSSKFEAKDFVHDRLGDATVREIDNFTSSLGDLSLEVSDEIKLNMDKSYKEIIVVNKNLNLATQELKNLRTNIEALNSTLKDFQLIATKKIESNSNAPYESSSGPVTPKIKSQPDFSLTPDNLYSAADSMRSSTLTKNIDAKKTKRHDRTSVLMLEKVWVQELNALWKQVEGAQKYVPALPGRHILVESGNWFEVNVATLKQLNNVHLIILNDLVLISTPKFASSPNSNSKSVSEYSPKSSKYVVSKCCPLRDVTIQPNEVEMRISMTFVHESNVTKAVYQCRNANEFHRVLNAIRGAKDDIKNSFSDDIDTTNKIRSSLVQLQRSPSTSNLSPRKSSHSRSTSTGNSINVNNASSTIPMTSSGMSKTISSQTHHDKRVNINSSTGLGLLTGSPQKESMSMINTISLSINARTKTRDLKSSAYQLKQIGDMVDSIDIHLSRKQFREILKVLDVVKKNISTYDSNYSSIDNDSDIVEIEQGQVLRQILEIKIADKSEMFVEKLYSILHSIEYLNDMDSIVEATRNLIDCKTISQYNILESFLNNRTTYIDQLIETVKSSLTDPQLYILETTVIRFQVLKKTATIFNELFKSSKLYNKLTSTLASWADSEIDKYFSTLSAITDLESVITPVFIKSTRKQIDALKTVGMDFVYKLDKFLQKFNKPNIQTPSISVNDGPKGLGFVKA